MLMQEIFFSFFLRGGWVQQCLWVEASEITNMFIFKIKLLLILQPKFNTHILQLYLDVSYWFECIYPCSATWDWFCFFTVPGSGAPYTYSRYVLVISFVGVKFIFAGEVFEVIGLEDLYVDEFKVSFFDDFVCFIV